LNGRIQGALVTAGWMNRLFSYKSVLQSRNELLVDFDNLSAQMVADRRHIFDIGGWWSRDPVLSHRESVSLFDNIAGRVAGNINSR
jgi:hypothetical protein